MAVVQVSQIQDSQGQDGSPDDPAAPRRGTEPQGLLGSGLTASYRPDQEVGVSPGSSGSRQGLGVKRQEEVARQPLAWPRAGWGGRAPLECRGGQKGLATHLSLWGAWNWLEQRQLDLV